MIAYGIASRAMYKHYNSGNTNDLSFDGRSIFRNIIYPSYYLMYGIADRELDALDRMFS